MVLAHNIEQGDRTKDVQISQNVTFDAMLLAPATLRGLKSSGFFRPSPIQLHGIPLGKCGFDLLLEAKSGTGKTAVFTVIALENMDLSKGLQAIILAPTREIAAQICDVITQIGSCYEGLKVEVVMGGLPIQEDIDKFQNNTVHIVVASPGRLCHLIKDKHIDVSAIRLLVLDEADKLLEKSFIKDINYIYSITPKQKQVLMSSATYPDNTRSFIKNYMQTAHHVCPDTNSILLGIMQKITVVKYNCNIVKQTKNRFSELLKILTKFSFKQCLIFCNYQTRVAELHRMLTKEKWPSEQLYGQQEQMDRLDALKSLQEYKCRILVSTDLAARGIDASNVDLVINFEPPYEWQTYLHRIGRAGRYGSYGIAITIISEGREQTKFSATIDNMKAPVNLSNLWDDTIFKSPNIHEEDTSQGPQQSEESVVKSVEDFTSKINLEEKFEELWKTLTSSTDENCDQIEVESFEQLCNSYKKPEYESFDDLLTSHNNHQVAADTVPSIFPQIQALPDIQHLKQDEIKDQKMCSNINISNNNSIILQNNNVLSISREDADLKNKMAFKSTAQHFKERRNASEDEYVVPNIDEDLIKAGLPTAFGKVKTNTCGQNHTGTTSKPPKKFNSHTHIIKSASKYNEESESSTDDTSESIERGLSKTNRNRKSNFKQKSDKKSSSYDGSNDYGYNSLSYDHERLYERSYKAANYSTLPSSKVYTDKKINDCYKSRTPSHEHSAYLSWYRKLKARVKQIEFNIYVDEMSKL